MALDSINADFWFYGGDIHATLDGSSSIPGLPLFNVAVAAATVGGATPIIRMFGSTVRVDVGVATTQPFPAGLSAIQALAGQVHMHGGILRADGSASTAAVNVRGILASNAGTLVHTPDTAFSILGGSSGTAMRTEALTGSQIQSPFTWPSGGSPPPAAAADGDDIFVEVDCASSGCASSGDETHLLIYNAAKCGPDPWFDVVTGLCR